MESDSSPAIKPIKWANVALRFAKTPNPSQQYQHLTSAEPVLLFKSGLTRGLSDFAAQSDKNVSRETFWYDWTGRSAVNGKTRRFGVRRTSYGMSEKRRSAFLGPSVRRGIYRPQAAPWRPGLRWEIFVRPLPLAISRSKVKGRTGERGSACDGISSANSIFQLAWTG